MAAPAEYPVHARPFHPVGHALEIIKEEISQTIPDRFEKIVRQYPDRLAIKSGDRLVTYDELNRVANRIARGIVSARGPGSEPIALFFENTFDVVGAIFGVLKAGKFFVILDPSWPENRIKFIFADSQAGLILARGATLSLARPLVTENVSVLNIDGIDESLCADNLGVSQLPEDFASILYTSGSTGEPKGVLDNHSVNLHHALLDDTTAEDRVSLLHSVAFGSGRAEVFLSLLNGASLLPFDLKSEGLHRLSKWLNQEQITICHLPPAAFQKLAEIYSVLDERPKLPHIRKLRLSGAPVTRVEFDLYKEIFGAGTTLQINMGSTETRRICGAIVDHDFAFPAEGVPVGYPAPWKDIILVDDNGCEVGAGEVGEIAVRSRYLCAGYWRKPELTRAKFVRASNGDEPRTYFTGDLGRLLADGFLIHLGRKDLMVKIRGYRVEVGEIERALVKHPQIREAGVAAWNREPDEKYLAAYIVPDVNAELAVDELRSFLRAELPDYMIPSVFMFMTSLPATNGKLDRRALPQPTDKRPALKQAYEPAGNQIESELAQIWETVLEVHPIGIHDNFFDLGGHSLSATRIVSQVIKRFQFEVPASLLFQSPTVAEMAAVLAKYQGKPIREKELVSLLEDLESLSEEEVRRLLEGKTS